MIADCHTHNLAATDAIISVATDFDRFDPSKPYSVGIHPWHTANAARDDFQRLEHLAVLPHVVAIGETGIDRNRGAERDLQIDIFRRQAELADAVGKPLIIHCVGGWNDILQVRRELLPQQPWIAHGFRGKPELARQLIDAGLYISLGERFNPAAAEIIPLERLFVETDESKLSIEEIARRISPPALGASIDNINRIILRNSYGSKKPTI